MRTLQRKDIHPIKLESNPAAVLINSGFRLINGDNYIYHYINYKWVNSGQRATPTDYLNIPQLL